MGVFLISRYYCNESRECYEYGMLGAAEHAADVTVNHCKSGSEQTLHPSTRQKRDTPRKRSEPTPSSHHSARTAPASVSCPAGFTIPAEPDPVSISATNRAFT